MRFNSVLKLVLVFVCAVALAGCGGGGSSSGGGSGAQGTSGTNSNGGVSPGGNLTPPGKGSNSGYLGIGTAFLGQSPAASSLPATSETQTGNIRIRSSGDWRDPRDGSHSAAEVVAYLKSFQTQENKAAAEQEREPKKIGTQEFEIRESKRVLRLYGATENEKELVREAVAEINTALPYNMRITIGQDLSRQIVDLTEEEEHYAPAGQIHLHFTRGRSSWTTDDYDLNTLGIGGVAFFDCNKTSCATSGFVFIDRMAVGSDKENMLWVLKHELLHAYGIVAHSNPEEYPDSVLGPILVDNPGNKPPIYLSIDGEGLLALTRIPPGTHLGDLNPSDLGNWTDTGFHLLGYAPLGDSDSFVQFGVGWRNGLAKPWAYGPKPDTSLQNHLGTTGSATWNGALLGFSGAGNTVAGDAQIEIDLSSMDGDADFTDLEYWAQQSHPGSPGSGQTWGDGDLGYSIDVSQGDYGEGFVSTSATGDDPGSVSGMFVGANHEGATGILEHPDLSAAFGGTRQN